MQKSNLNLLKILAALGVIILHYNHAEIGGAFGFVSSGSISSIWLNVSESICICAVNVFILISGYFLSKKKTINQKKIISVIVLVLFFKVIPYLSLCMTEAKHFDIITLLSKFLITDYYVILYCVMFLLSPYLNIIVNKLERQDFKKFILLIFAIFSIYSYSVECLEFILGSSLVSMSPVGVQGSQAGFTIVNFILLYFFGAYINKFGFELPKLISVIGLPVAIFLITAMSYFGNRAWSYNSPLVIVEALLIFNIFLNIRITNSIIDELSKSTLACYIMHTTYMKYLGIELAVSRGLVFIIFHQIITSVLLYLAAYVLWKLYDVTLGKMVSSLTNRDL